MVKNFFTILKCTMNEGLTNGKFGLNQSNRVHQVDFAGDGCFDSKPSPK
jgi:hypothetical protein